MLQKLKMPEAEFEWLAVPFEDACAEISSIGGGSVSWRYRASDCVHFLVDADVYPYVSQLPWFVVRGWRDGPAWHDPRVKQRRAPECLHRWILRTLKGDPPHGAYMHAGFVNGDRLDCRIANLRWVLPNRYFGA